MILTRSVLISATFLAFAGSLGAQAPNVEPYRANASKIIAAAVADSMAWNRVAYMADTFGNRLSGSPALESAIDWIVGEMKKDGLETCTPSR